MSILDRILDARAEVLALVNGIVYAAGQFGFSLTDEQQAAINGLVSVGLILAARIFMGASATSFAPTPKE